MLSVSDPETLPVSSSHGILATPRQMADHYGTAIVPARAGHAPSDR